MGTRDSWHERLSWAADLIADDSSDRRRAHLHLMHTQRRCARALREYNQVWDRPQHPEYDDRASELRYARDNTLPDALWQFINPGTLADWDDLPHALLYLRWEILFPDEW